MTAQAWLLLAVHGLFMLANALSGAFVNVYLWKMKSDFALIGLFALANQFALGSMFYLWGRRAKERGKMGLLRWGMTLSAVFYFFVLWVKDDAIRYIVPLGLVQGAAAGLFWLAFNVVYFEITEPDNRDRFNGWSGLSGSLSNMIAPWVSGFLISLIGGTRGYMTVFTVSLIIFALGAVLSFWLHKRKPGDKYNWAYATNRLRRKGDVWRSVCLALSAQGIREGVFIFLVGLLVFEVTTNEMRLGQYFLASSAIGLVGYWLAGKWLKPSRRNLAMLMGAVVMVGALVPFFWRINYFTLMMFGLSTGFIFPFYMMPMMSSVFDLIGADKGSAEHRVEFVVLRELALNMGRMAGTLLFIAIVWLWHLRDIPPWLILLIGVSPLANWLFISPFLRRGVRN